jgi:hypothetical protein
MITAIINLVLAVHAQPDIMEQLRGQDPHSVRAHPTVMADATCSTTVARIKKGPMNIPEVQYWST